MGSISYSNAGRLARTRRLTVKAEQGGEQTRRRIVNLVFIIYWLLIFEGVLRKWIFPDAFKILFFIRDPFVLIGYALAVFNYRPLHASYWLACWLVFGLTALVVGLAQLWAGATDLMVLGYGWRNYFYYIPLAFVIGANFRQADLYRLIRQTLLIAIPIAVLVCLQIVSPSQAVINAGVIEGGLYNPGTVKGFVRTFGTFTSGTGQTLFVASLMAMLLANWILPGHQRPVKGFLLSIVSAAVIMNLALSGSRGAYILSVLITLFAILSISLLPHKTNRFSGVVLFFIIAINTVLVVSILSKDVSEAIFERVAGAHYSESELYGPLGTMGRIIFDFGNFAKNLSLSPHFGYGVGWFGNAFASQIVFGSYAEDDWSRNIFELGPVIGLLFMSFRIALVVWLTKAAVVAVRRVGNPVPLLFVGFIGVILLQGQITGHGSANGYGWLFAGFCIAANRVGQMPSQFPVARD